MSQASWVIGAFSFQTLASEKTKLFDSLVDVLASLVEPEAGTAREAMGDRKDDPRVCATELAVLLAVVLVAELAVVLAVVLVEEVPVDAL